MDRASEFVIVPFPSMGKIALRVGLFEELRVEEEVDMLLANRDG